MQRKWIIIAVALAAWPAGLTAQGTPRPPRPPREPRARAFMLSDQRGRIGVVVRTDASPETDKLGAKIEGVTPGGPADKVGLKVGDVITKFNGTSLAAVKAEDEDESGPGRKLIELARRLEPDDTVQIEFRRGNDTKQATLVAADMGGRFRRARTASCACTRSTKGMRIRAACGTCSCGAGRTCSALDGPALIARTGGRGRRGPRCVWPGNAAQDARRACSTWSKALN